MKKMMVGVVALMLGGTAFALTMKERQQVEKWHKALEGSTSQGRFVKTRCGVDIPAAFDEDMVTPFMEANASAAAYCDSAREAIGMLCADATAKKAVVEQIAKVSCKVAPKGTVSFKLGAKTFEMSVGPDVSNLSAKAKKYLEDNLK